MGLSIKWSWVILTFLMLGAASVLSETETEKNEEEGGQESEMPRVGHINFQKHRQDALVGELREKELVWLDVEYPSPEGGGNSNPGPVKVLALQRPSQKPHQHGAVLILPERGQHADWPTVVRPIRGELPESGWYTLSLSLPEEGLDSVPKRALPVKQFDELELNPALRVALNQRTEKKDEETTSSENGTSEEVVDSEGSEGQENADAGDSDDKPVDIDLADKEKALKAIPYSDRALSHVNAGISYLQSQGYQNIVLLAYRSSANVAMQYLTQKQGTFRDKGFAIVLVDPLFDKEFQLDLSEALGKNFPAPILEMVNTEEDERDVKSRLAFARVNGANRYMQVNYAFDLSEGSHKSLIRRIRFWLEKHAPGMIVGPGARR